VTYNFDADRWLARQLDALGERRRRGELDGAGYRREREALEIRHQQMFDRLDGTFELPPARGRGPGPPADDGHREGRG